MPRRPQARGAAGSAGTSSKPAVRRVEDVGEGVGGGDGRFPSTARRETETKEGGRASKAAIDDSGAGATTSSHGGMSSSGTHVAAAAAAAALGIPDNKVEVTWKRKSTLPNGERKPYYCFSCKQALKPADFDPGLETCRICLAKRRAKDREKKRLRAMQLKHHLLSADEKEVAAFLLGVYHPAVHRPPDGPTQMHMQVSLNVTEFVSEFKEILKGKSRKQAECVVSAFLGRASETTRKSSKKVSEACGGGVRSKPTKVTPRKRRKYTKAPKTFLDAVVEDSALSSGAGNETLEHQIDAVFNRYNSVLEKSMDQTWVRFAHKDEANGDHSVDLGVDVIFSRPVHESDQNGSLKSSQSDSMALACPTSEMFSSIMHGADPLVSEFLHEFLFTSNEEHATVTDEPWTSVTDAEVDDHALALLPKEEASDNYLYDYNTIEEFQQDGSAYAFKGSLVMGWIGGTSGSPDAGMLSSDNGVLPDTLHPQAISRNGKIFDARTPGALVLLEETEYLRGFDEDIESYPVVDSVSSDIRITLARESFSEELGIRALHDGKYIECEVLKNEETVDIILYPNGKPTSATDARAGVVLLGVVYLQCFVRTGAAKQLPIGMNIPVLLLPNAACAEEVRYGVEQIFKLRGGKEARQFIVSLGIALQNGDTKSTKFSFVLEMAYILKLKRTLNMLELVASLAKLPSLMTSSDSESESSKVGKEVLDAITVTIFADYRDKVATMYRPGACVAFGLVHLFASPSKLDHSTLDAVYAFIILLSAAVLSIALSKRQVYEMDVVAISALFAFSQAALLHAAPSFDVSDIQYRMIAYVYAVATTWSLTLMHSMQSVAGILAANTISVVIFSYVGFVPTTLTEFLVASWPQDMYLPPLAIIVHGIVTHFGLSSLGPMLFAGLIRKSISWYVQTNYNSSSHLKTSAGVSRLQKQYAHSPERSHSVSQ